MALHLCNSYFHQTYCHFRHLEFSDLTRVDVDGDGLGMKL